MRRYFIFTIMFTMIFISFTGCTRYIYHRATGKGPLRFDDAVQISEAWFDSENLLIQFEGELSRAPHLARKRGNYKPPRNLSPFWVEVMDGDFDINSPYPQNINYYIGQLKRKFVIPQDRLHEGIIPESRRVSLKKVSAFDLRDIPASRRVAKMIEIAMNHDDAIFMFEHPHTYDTVMMVPAELDTYYYNFINLSFVYSARLDRMQDIVLMHFVVQPAPEASNPAFYFLIPPALIIDAVFGIPYLLLSQGRVDVGLRIDN